jgi:hypothetical protein
MKCLGVYLAESNAPVHQLRSRLQERGGQSLLLSHIAARSEPTLRSARRKHKGRRRTFGGAFNLHLEPR